MAQLQIKFAENEDIETIAKLLKKCFSGHNVFSKSILEVTAYCRDLHNNNKGKSGGFLIAVAGKIIVGTVLVQNRLLDEKTNHSLWKVNHLVVHPTFRRKGVGSTLLETAERHVNSFLKAQGIKTAKVEGTVSEREKPIMNLYRKYGAKVEGVLGNHYRYKEKAYIMGKTIKVF